jgi:AcrR family transcriptional regulator
MSVTGDKDPSKDPSKDQVRRSAKWQARRDTIVDTSARVFAQNGYHATGLTELCLANNLGKGALYHYIGSKEELLAAIHDRVMDEVIASGERVTDAGGTATAQLARLGDELLDIIARYPHHVWVFLHEFPALTGERAEQFRTRRRRYEKRVEEVFRAGIASGEFRDLDPRLATLAWLGMHNYTYLWMHPGGPHSAHEVATQFADLYARGIVTAPSSPRPPRAPSRSSTAPRR